MPKVSICIPIHDTPNTAFYLARMMQSIAEQSFTDYEIVITKEGKFAENHNAAIKKAKGEIVQMMQMDDYFANSESLRSIVKGFDSGKEWQITSCWHDSGGIIGNPHQAEWTDDIYTGNNRLGSVSTLSMRRDKALLFEEPLQWLVDVNLYYRLYKKYGYPHLNPSRNVVIDTRNDRLTHTLSDELKRDETIYMASLFKK